MQTTTCPSRDDLAAFTLGGLPAEQRQRIDAHLDDCPACQAQLETIGEAEDTLLSRLRRPATAAIDSPVVERALAAIEAIGRDPSFTGGAAARWPESAPQGIIRDYRLLAPLGAGGMGAVYKALHLRLDKVVALKLLPAERLNPTAVARFQREMKAVGKLDHPNIVRALDAGEHEGTHFLVMECVEGEDLSQLVARFGPLPIAAACEIVRQTAAALQHAHQHGLVHRDIKPSNLMLASPPTVKLLDLGLALLQETHEQVPGDELTAASQMMGTADYIAPEQAGDSHSVDIRADIYSLGCTLYKLLTGEAPYSGAEFNTPLKKMMAHVGRPLPDARRLRPEISDELLAVLGRMTAKQPVDRYATPADVAAAIAPFAAGADLSALAAPSPLLSPSPLVGEGRGERLCWMSSLSWCRS